MHLTKHIDDMTDKELWDEAFINVAGGRSVHSRSLFQLIPDGYCDPVTGLCTSCMTSSVNGSLLVIDSEETGNAHADR